jgi:hypothetical protein
MVSIQYNYNEMFNILEHEVNSIQDNLLIIKNENQKIILDNVRLNQRIEKLEFTNFKKDIEIKELKNEIKELKEDNKKKDIEIKELKQDNIKLKQDNKELKDEIKELKFDKLKSKIFEALSDIINNENLEEQISEIYDDLIYLKSSRNNICHYIRNNDKKDIKNKKIAITIDILKNISNEIKNELISEFENDIIEKIIDYYEKNQLFINSSNISEKDLIRINNWWK